MFARLSTVFVFLVTAFVVLLPAQGVPKVREVAVPSLPDIAMVRFVPGKQPMILYNPILCREAGPALCEFYRFHEYAHIQLRHHERDDLSRQEKESEADRWAAQHAPLASVMAAYRFFSAGGGSTPIHGSSSHRAERMLARTEPVGLRAAGRTPVEKGRKLSESYAAGRRDVATPLLFGALAL